MEFRLLGPLEVRVEDGPLPIGGPKQRTVLALLLLDANRVVSVDRLTEAVWGSEPPETARNTLQTYVRHLRKALGAERIEHRSSGYVLVAGPDEVDLLRFEVLLEDARRLASTDPTSAIATFREALGLWHGPALDDLADQPSLRPEIARLEESRLAAVEERIGTDLALGRHRELVPELETLVGRHPFRERLWGQLMVALYRSGRQGDALAAYRRARELLVEELGVDPSPELQRLEEQILRHDVELELAGEPLRGYRLIEPLGEGAFGAVSRAHQPQVGREVAIKTIHRELANDPEFVRRFEHEARVVARLEHPHVVPLYDYWRDADGAYLVMRYLRGGSLRSAIDREGSLDPSQTAGILEQVAQALDTAHRQGIVHSDVKPENILLDEDGNAYLSDFGIARELSDARTARSGKDSSSPYASPEQLRRDVVTPASDLYSLGLVLHEMLTGRPPFDGSRAAEDERRPSSVLELRPDLPAAVDEVLLRATAADPALRFADALSMATAFRDAIAMGPVAPAPSPEVANPYKGLHPFDEPDARDFFGRELMVERLVARLAEDVDGARLLAVVGPSGSGKSSLVRAGLVPALRRGAIPGSESWFVTELAPGAHPFEELEAALLRVAIDPPGSLAEQLERDRRGLVRAVRRILPDDGTTELVLIVDQLEELFTLTPSEAERSAFLAAIAEAVTDPGSRLRVIAMLRADFYDRPLLDARFGPLLGARTEAVTPLTPDELERAIAGPAERVGVSLEPALVAEIVADVSDQPGALPLLQYALTELFELRRDGTMTLAAYREIGGVTGALAGRAEELFSALDEGRGEACRQLFLRLVSLGEGTEDTRRRVLRSELDTLEVDRAEMDAVIETFGRHRLLSFDRDASTREPTVELAHEALIPAWRWLRDWIDEGREDVRTHRRLAAAADEWLASGREPSFLLSGARLERFASWKAEGQVALAEREREFVRESLERHEAAVAAERARLEHERSLERRSVRRMRALVAVLAVASLVASSLTIVAANRSREAERLRDEATVAALTEAAVSNLSTDPEHSLLLVLHAVDLSATIDLPVPTETVEALHWAIQESSIEYPVREGPAAVVTGPLGSRGVFDLPLSQLVEHVRPRITTTLAPEDCDRFFGTPACPTLASTLPSDLEVEPLELSDPATAGGSLAGTRVTIYAGNDPELVEAFREDVRAFAQRTGIEIRPVGNPEFHDYVIDSLAAGDPPDIAFIGQPGVVAGLAREGRLIDLGTYLDVEQLEADTSPYLVSLGTVGPDGSWPAADGGRYGAFVSLAVKGWIWHPVPEFEAAGYDVPETLDDLTVLGERLLADGHTPWCVGFESGDASGWPGTDWIESLLLAEAGPDVYDRWTFHELPFDSPPVRRAFERFGEIVFTPGVVLGGTDRVLGSSFADTATPLVSADPPGCWLHHQASFLAEFLPAGAAGRDTDVFPFPPVDGSSGGLIGGGDLLVAIADRPEVREVVRFLLSPRFGEGLAGGSGFMLSNRRFDLSNYDPFWRGQAEVLNEALAADTFRFDASDLMPPRVGAGAFWDAMMTYVSEGPEILDRILGELDAAWPDDG